MVRVSLLQDVAHAVESSLKFARVNLALFSELGKNCVP